MHWVFNQETLVKMPRAASILSAAAWNHGEIIGSTANKAAINSMAIAAAYPNAAAAWYWVLVNGTPTQLYIDNSYSGGGWVMVATHPLSTSIPGFTYAQTTTNVPQLGSSGFTVGSSDPKQYATFMPLRQWTYITSANNNGNNFVYFTAASKVELGNTASHQRRSRWTWTGWGSAYAWQGANNLVNEVGGTTPDLWNYHIGNGYNWTTYDADQDAYSGNCSTSYNNAPFWYGACWSGSFWGDDGAGGYSNSPFWTGSAGDWYNYGAYYIR